ncbi:MAG: ferrous iron transport protein B [Firmicutes bacterium]|nr:ferrous iron transport protein B [Bacillota bacterium]
MSSEIKESAIPARGKKIVLAGNPNVGKSVFFNALTGLYVDVSNYPGTTLDIACGRSGGDVVIDTPGVYGLSSFSKEEEIARDIILSADVVVNVVDAVHLERDLFLTRQIIDTGVPVIVALNMIDEAEKEGLRINVRLLSDLLGVPVLPTVAVQGVGIAELKEIIGRARPGRVEAALLDKLGPLAARCGQGQALLILEGDPVVAARCGVEPGTGRESLYRERRELVNRIVLRAVRETGEGSGFAGRLGALMLKPSTGFPLLIITLFAVYELVGVFIAQVVVEFTEDLMRGYYEPAVRSLVGSFLSPGSVAGVILAGQFGLLTLTVTYIIGLLLPLVLGFFLVLSTLEDSGYLPRIATLVDRTLISLGLNGQAVIPLILGFGCVTMACITTRILGSDREKRIATFLLAFAVPCSSQMAFITAVLAGMGLPYMILYTLLIFAILTGAGTLLARFLPGRPSPLFIELPPVRMPRIQNVFQKAWTKTYHFILEAFPLFAGGALLLSLLDVTGLLAALQNLLVPLTVGWLHLPKEAADPFIMGFIRRDFGTAGILSLPLLPLQKFVALVTLTLFVPCIAATMVIFKERGWREGAVIWPSVFILAFITGGCVTRLLEAFEPYGNLQISFAAGTVASLLAFLVLIQRVFPPRRAGG